MGIEPLADNHTYFVSLESYANDINPGVDWGKQIIKELPEAQRRPWKAGEFPLIAGWLAANRPSIDLVVEASRRPRWYSPLISGQKPPLLACLLPAVQQERDASRALAARTMARLQEGKLDQAWADLLAGHRLARLIGQGPTLVESLVAITIEGKFCEADQALLQDSRLTAAQIAAMRADLARLPPPADLADKFDTTERFMYLDTTAWLRATGWAHCRRYPCFAATAAGIPSTSR